jgi:hypothetical protein
MEEGAMKVIKSAGGAVTAGPEHWEGPRKQAKPLEEWERPRRKRGRQGKLRHGRRKLTVEELKGDVKVMFEVPGYLLQTLDNEADAQNVSRTKIFIDILKKIYGDSAWEGFLLAVPPEVESYEDKEPLIVKQIREELERRKEYEAERFGTGEGEPPENNLPQWWGDRAVPGEPFADTEQGRGSGVEGTGGADPGDS